MVERNVKGKYNLCDVNSVFNRRYQEKKNRCPAIVGISGDRNTISGNHKVFDGLLFLVTGIYIGGWDNCSLLMTSLILVFVFAIIQILVRKKSAKSEIPFVPFVLSAYMLYLGGQMI